MLAKILKANPFHDHLGRFTTEGGARQAATHSKELVSDLGGRNNASGGIPPNLKPAFPKGKKVTIQDASAALKKQGFTMQHHSSTPDGVSYRITDKKGKSYVVTGRELTKALTSTAKKFDND